MTRMNESPSRPVLAPGDDVFIYGGPGLVSRLVGWAHSSVELFFGDGVRQPVAVYRDQEGHLDISATAVALSAAQSSWHLVSPDGRIVGGGPRTYLPSLSREELEAQRDSGQHGFQNGALPCYGIPPTALRSRCLNGAAERAPAVGGFTAARGGHYQWATNL
ncbi:hypothetical protein OG612_45480 (plasmid) [Streptomyces sp. NBC_01527]|uniref:hypothetical protein n=1 Tax=Streptomyces sp. NBC_01527 TaxID=2903894 RepID=UPI002F90E665